MLRTREELRAVFSGLVERSEKRALRLQDIETISPISEEIIAQMPIGNRTFASRTLWEKICDALGLR